MITRVLLKSKLLYLAALAPKNKSGRLYLKDFDTYDIRGVKIVDNRVEFRKEHAKYVVKWKKYREQLKQYYAKGEGTRPTPPMHPFDGHLIYFDYENKDIIYAEKMSAEEAKEYAEAYGKEYDAEFDVGRVEAADTNIESTSPLTERDIVRVLEHRVSLKDETPARDVGPNMIDPGDGIDYNYGTGEPLNFGEVAHKVLSGSEYDELYDLQDKIAELDAKEYDENRMKGGEGDEGMELRIPKNYGIPLYFYGTNEPFRKVVDAIIMSVANSQMSKRHPNDRLPFNEVYTTDFTRLLIAKDYGEQYTALAKKVQSEIEAIQNLEPKDAPKVPHANPNFRLMPHQAVALAMLDRVDTGLIGVATGGGKTGILVLDILNLLAKKKIKRALIVMPSQSNLVAQQKKEIEKEVTDGTINVIGITTQTFNALAPDPKQRYIRLRSMINSAPPNTIILATYEWFVYGEKDAKVIRKLMGRDDKGVEHAFERSFFLMKECGIDYVALDESHKIRNPSSKRSQAIMSFASCPVRRLSSGTVIENNPDDLHRQISFLDPMIFGNKDNYIETFAESTTTSRNGKALKAVTWKDGAGKTLRRMMKENGAILTDRAHWLHLLPKMHGPVLHPCKMSSAQKSVYKTIFEEIIDSLQKEAEAIGPDGKYKNKALHDAWVKFQDMSTDDDEEEQEGGFYSSILAKLSVIDGFLNSPIIRPTQVDPGKTPAKRKRGEEEKEQGLVWKIPDSKNPGKRISVDKILQGDDRISPKVKEIDKILDEHFADPKNGKVLIVANHKQACKHLSKYIKRTAQAGVYFSGKKDVLAKFLDPNSKMKIMFATSASVEVGLNLQYVANRFIRCDVVWNPGSMDQGFARIWRVGSKDKKKSSQFEDVYVDFVLADESIDYTKFARFVWKENYARQINSAFKTNIRIPVVAMNMGFIKNMNTHSQVMEDGYYPHYMTMYEQEKEQNKKLRKTYGDALYDVRSDAKIAGAKKIETPHVGPRRADEGADEEEEANVGMIEVKRTSSGKWMEIDPEEMDISPRLLKANKWKKDKKREVWFKVVKKEEDVQEAADDLKNSGVTLHINDPKKSEEELEEKAQETGKTRKEVREEEVEKVEREEASHEETIPVKMEIYDATEENATRKTYLRIPRTSGDLKVLKSLGFNYHLRWFYYAFKSKSDAVRMLNRIIAKKIHINGDDLETLHDEIMTTKFTYSKIKTGPGKVELIKRLPKKRTIGEISVYLDWRNAKPVLVVGEKESTVDLQKLKTLGFKDVDPPMYWRVIKSSNDLTVVLKKLRRKGVRCQNWKEFKSGIKKWRLKIPKDLNLSSEEEMPGED